MKQNYGPFGQEYFVESPEPVGALDDFVEAERRSIVDKLDKLDDLLKQRKDLMYGNVDRLVQNSLYVSAKIQHVKLQDPYNNRRIDFLCKLSTDIDKQIGMEQSTGWKDAWLIEKERLTAMQEYDRFKRLGALK